MTKQASLLPGFGLLGFGLLAAACGTNASPSDRLPSVAITPHTTTQTAEVACGEDVTLGEQSAPDLRYAFAYDSGGRLAHAQGVYTAGGPDASIAYSWDSADRFTHLLETHGWGDSSTEITETYDGDQLASYAYAVTSPDYNANWIYTYSNYVGPWQPLRELVTTADGAFGYALAYDSFGRLISLTPDSGPATTITYDDAARTVTQDTGNGAWTDVTTYRADWAELSDVWGGSDSSAVAGSYTYLWDGDSLVSTTYRSGSADAPQQLETLEVDTLRYDCASARKTMSLRLHAPGHLVAPRVAGHAQPQLAH